MHTDISFIPHQGTAPIATLDQVIGQGTAIQDIREQIRLVAQADCRVLLVGEKGSGKETIARAIHACSMRRHLPFHIIDCAEFYPDTSLHPFHLLTHAGGTLQYSEQNDLPIDLANGGTLYLHEVGALTPEAQTWLLRCLLSIEMESLNQPECEKEKEIRVIAGTSQNLQDNVAAQRFRAELFFRLNVVPLHIPPLRQRAEDIELLANHFVRLYAGKYGKTIETISDKTIQVLRNYHWPQNIEELRGVLERAIILSKGPTLHLEHIVQDPTNFPFHS